MHESVVRVCSLETTNLSPDGTTLHTSLVSELRHTPAPRHVWLAPVRVLLQCSGRVPGLKLLTYSQGIKALLVLPHGRNTCDLCLMAEDDMYISRVFHRCPGFPSRIEPWQSELPLFEVYTRCSALWVYTPDMHLFGNAFEPRN